MSVLCGWGYSGVLRGKEMEAVVSVRAGMARWKCMYVCVLEILSEDTDEAPAALRALYTSTYHLLTLYTMQY